MCVCVCVCVCACVVRVFPGGNELCEQLVDREKSTHRRLLDLVQLEAPWPWVALDRDPTNRSLFVGPGGKDDRSAAQANSAGGNLQRIRSKAQELDNVLVYARGHIETLAAILDADRVGPTTALCYLQFIYERIRQLHQAGVVYNWLSPGNISLTRLGQSNESEPRVTFSFLGMDPAHFVDDAPSSDLFGPGADKRHLRQWLFHRSHDSGDGSTVAPEQARATLAPELFAQLEAERLRKDCVDSHSGVPTTPPRKPRTLPPSKSSSSPTCSWLSASWLNQVWRSSMRAPVKRPEMGLVLNLFHFLLS